MTASAHWSGLKKFSRNITGMVKSFLLPNMRFYCEAKIIETMKQLSSTSILFKLNY